MKKTVLLISHMPPPLGGIATWTKKVVEHEIPGYDIQFVNSSTIGGRDPFKSPKRSLRVELKRARNIYRATKKVLKNHKIDVMHDNIPCTLFGNLRELHTARIAKKFKVPFILHCHSTLPNMVNTKLNKFWFKRLLKKCSGVIVLNQKSYDFVKSFKTNTYVKIIPNFVLNKELSLDRKINPTLSKISYVGGVVKEKGCKLIHDIASFFPEIKFELVGNINEEIANLDKLDNFELLGPKHPDEIKGYLDTTDAFFFLTKFQGEGFSVSLTEAMGAGLPCIATDWAANKDMLENKGGVIIDVDNLEQLKDAINKIKDQEVRKQMSEWNIEKVKNYYSADVVINSYAEFYDYVKEHNRWRK